MSPFERFYERLNMLENVTKDVKEACDNILSTFGGEDGGISFTNFYRLVEQMDEKYQNGDEAAKKLLDVIIQFNKFIEVANNGKRARSD